MSENVRKDNPGTRTPFIAFGGLATMAMWQLATLGIAVEILTMLLPWSLGLIDGTDPEQRKLLQKYRVQRFPTALVLSPSGSDNDYAIIEPFDWDAMFGIPRSSFEFEQTYSKELERVLDRAATSGGRLRPGGTEVGGSGCDIVGS